MGFASVCEYFIGLRKIIILVLLYSPMDASIVTGQVWWKTILKIDGNIQKF